MSFAELLKELEATGMSKNTVCLCVNCYYQGMVNERVAIIKLAKDHLDGDHASLILDIMDRNKQDKPEGH
jgi:hypothetical protein